MLSQADGGMLCALQLPASIMRVEKTAIRVAITRQEHDILQAMVDKFPGTILMLVAG